MDILKEKTFPSQYPADAVKVLKAMSFTNSKGLQIVGSQSLRSQLYAGDYDAYEIVDGKFPTNEAAAKHYSQEFKRIIKDLMALDNVYIGDIKCGVIEDWRVIPKKTNYNFRSATIKVDSLFQNKIISPKEAQFALSFIKPRATKLDTLKARDEIKFHIIRWTPQEILKGETKLRDGSTYTLEQGIQSPTITKLDVIALIQSRYTELSVVYEFHNGSTTLNPDIIDPERSLRDSIQLLTAQGNLFKAVKRKFALAKLKNDYRAVEKYHSVLNSDLGKLYIVYSDVKTIITLLEDNELPRDKLNDAIQGFKHRLARIYALEDYLKTEKSLLAQLDDALKQKNPLPTLHKVEQNLMEHLSKATHLYGSGMLC